MSAKKIAFIGSNPNSDSFKVDTVSAFATSGNNTGNYAFWNAVDSHISGPRTYFSDWRFDPIEIKDNYDVIVLPASNFLHPARDMGGLAARLEKAQLPIIIVGLGAQAVHKGEAVELKPGTIRFAKLLGERCKTIGVRGEFTAEVMNSIGVKNVSVAGCPSNFTNLNPRLGTLIEEKLDAIKGRSAALRSIVVNVDAHRQKFLHDYRDLLSLINGFHYEVVCQNPVELVKMARGDDFDMTDPHVQFQHKLWGEHMSEDDFRNYVAAKFITFFNARAWLEYLRKFDLSVGTRFHGNMLAFQAGVPALFITHDARTSELVDLLKLPSCPINAVKTGEVDGILASTRFEGAIYDRNRKMLHKHYVEMFTSEGVALSMDLLNFGGEA